MSEHADQFEDEPGDDELEDSEEIDEPDSERLPWAKTSSGDADEI